MAKRLTDTDKWKKPFIRGLPAEYKLLFLYIIDDCDFCGIWHVDIDIAQIRLCCSFSIENAIRLFHDKIHIIDGGAKWFIPDFIKFQYGEQLSLANRMHRPVVDKLSKLNLLQFVECEVVEQGTTPGAIRSRVTQKVKDKIFLRDEFTCQYCSVQYPKQELVIDHICPINKGGDSKDDNLCSSCARCNRYKSDYTLIEFINKGHQFISLTNLIKEKLEGAYKILNAPSNLLDGAIYKDTNKDKDKDIKGLLGENEMPPKPKSESISNAEAPPFYGGIVPTKTPTQQEVREFFVRSGGTIAQADRFFNHYEGLSWRKGNSPIYNWAAFANNWLAGDNSKPEPTQQQGSFTKKI